VRKKASVINKFNQPQSKLFNQGKQTNRQSDLERKRKVRNSPAAVRPSCSDTAAWTILTRVNEFTRTDASMHLTMVAWTSKVKTSQPNEADAKANHPLFPPTSITTVERSFLYRLSQSKHANKQTNK
jgi:hypothetical protein